MGIRAMVMAGLWVLGFMNLRKHGEHASYPTCLMMWAVVMPAFMTHATPCFVRHST